MEKFLFTDSHALAGTISVAESQRDSGFKPRVARDELPWVSGKFRQPQRGCGGFVVKADTTPLGLVKSGPVFTQGGSCLATLGFAAESLWDSKQEFLKGMMAGNIFSTEDSLREQIQTVSPLRPVVRVAVHLPEVRDVVGLEPGMDALADADESVLVAAGEPEQF